ncbi:metallophosphatase family protein [Metabacillus sp. GX 13764]|uniref:metallophosphoesterase family protein n=1 Tax=Metabacillus kandeliae TaxID=2900151 RepID=UPI001E4E6AE7|nr:metallophosphoesterase family protein [Metabacillus kandeliae]MCD7036148.1 metallophosphatase family protein [Metabacillus kandeliae]
MDKIAVISDIHGNIPALEAVLEQISRQNISRIFCLGDLAGKGPESKKAIAMIQEACELTVKGNWDDFIIKETEFETLKWHQAQLDEGDCSYLAGLPFSKDLVMSGRRIRLFHASPYSLYTRVQPWDSLEKRLGMFENTELTGMDEPQPDVVGYGDVHQAFVQHFHGKTLFNTGSVGNPLDLPQASYAVIEGEIGMKEKAPFSIQLARVPYDIERAINIAREMKMPELAPYVQEITTSRYRGLKEQ